MRLVCASSVYHLPLASYFNRHFNALTVLACRAGFAVFAAYSFSPKSQNLLCRRYCLGLRKLNVLGSALYIAAHPDDENTRLIAYLANGRLLETGYLSCTRGDGGQNLVGPELREGLGRHPHPGTARGPAH